jgi:uncharacterized membrane protein
MPGWRPITRRVITTLATVTLLPMGAFYTSMSLFGLRAAALVAVGLYYVGLLVTVARRRPILTAALLGAGLLSIRAAVMFFTGNALVYFLQPIAGTVAVATLIGVTALTGRPVLDRLAHDFCPFPAELSCWLRQTRFFIRLSVVWSVTYLINAAGSVWLLTTSSVGGFIVMKSLIFPALSGCAVVTSYAIFRMTVRHQNVRIRWAHHQRWAAAG